MNPVATESGGKKPEGNARLNNQLCTKKWGGHYAPLVVIQLWSYTRLKASDNQLDQLHRLVGRVYG